MKIEPVLCKVPVWLADIKAKQETGKDSHFGTYAYINKSHILYCFPTFMDIKGEMKEITLVSVGGNDLSVAMTIEKFLILINRDSDE